MVPCFRFVLACGVITAAVGAEDDAALAAHATALHTRLFTIDTHLDTPTFSLRRPGWDISRRHDVRTDFSQCDFPRMREGGLKAAVFAIYVDQGPRTPEGFAAVRDNALRTALRVHAVANRFPGECELALTADDGPRIAAQGKRAIYLSIENGYVIGGDLTLLKTFHDLGVRIFGFVHNGNTDLAGSSQPNAGEPRLGLTPLGEQAVRECNRLGLVIDASHASDATTRELMAQSKTPILLTHSGCAAVQPHARNVSDDLLRELAAHGGVIQVNTVPSFLVPDVVDERAVALKAAERELAARHAGRSSSDADDAEHTLERRRLIQKFYPQPVATFDDFLRHLFHAIDVAGVEHVGIGADMDGGGGVVGLQDVSDYPKITLALLKRGMTDADVEKIWGGNTLRVLRAAEELARKTPPPPKAAAAAAP